MSGQHSANLKGDGSRDSKDSSKFTVREEKHAITRNRATGEGNLEPKRS